MGAKLRVMLAVALLALGVTGCVFVDPASDYSYLHMRGIYGPGGGLGAD
jgi:hypothetical protein